MRKRKCLKEHNSVLESVCMVERLVLFHGTRFRIGLAVHEFWCPKCKRTRDIWFIS